MKHILFILLTLLTFTSYSQDTKTIDFTHNSLDETIASKFLTLVNTNIGCCEELDLKKQKSYQIIVYFTTDPYYMGGHFDLYHYYELLQEDTYADSIAQQAFDVYKNISEYKRKSFKKFCYQIDKQITLDDNMSDDCSVCAVTRFRVTFYFQ
jgi:hypothetical protein